MTQETKESVRRAIRDWLNLTAVATLIALALSLYNFYRSYLYVSQQLDVTVSEVSYLTNRGELYMILAFSNPGNRDAALLRVEPLLWTPKESGPPDWGALAERVSEIPLTAPRTPMVIRAGGVEVITLSTQLDARAAERAAVESMGGAFIGIRVASMNAGGSLYQLEQAVAKLTIGQMGTIESAEPAVHRTLAAFSDDKQPPPGDRGQLTKQTPFVWADQHWAE